ncbi:MAG: hypothetical protein J6A28_00165 [Clostridia bacterium]|nr:hypothetical protein [Clostridia bacterium]
MEKRYLSDIKWKDQRIVSFNHSEDRWECSINSFANEAITYYNGVLHIYPANGANCAESYKATKEDFNALKEVILKNPAFVCCGDIHIFNLDHIVKLEKRPNCLYVDCRYGLYGVDIKNKEDVKEFVMAMKRKWKKAIDDFDQNDTLNDEEDCL